MKENVLLERLPSPDQRQSRVPVLPSCPQTGVMAGAVAAIQDCEGKPGRIAVKRQALGHRLPLPQGSSGQPGKPPPYLGC